MRAATLMVTTLHAWSDATASNAECWSGTGTYDNYAPPELDLEDVFDEVDAHREAIRASRALARLRRDPPHTRVTPTQPRAWERAEWLTMPRRAPRHI